VSELVRCAGQAVGVHTCAVLAEVMRLLARIASALAPGVMGPRLPLMSSCFRLYPVTSGPTLRPLHHYNLCCVKARLT